MDTAPISIALVAGGLATLNPCGFPLLPAFLSFYAGADEARLPRAPSRVLQGLFVGLLVTVGFLTVFALIGLPVSYGAGIVSRAVPWVGLVIGAILAAVGLLALAGRRVALPIHLPVRFRRERGVAAMLFFGGGYALASLGCTLPIFLTLLGASIGSGNSASTLRVFAAYGFGMALVLMALSVGAALVREGVTRALRAIVPHMSRISGALLFVSGGYLVYYWARVRFGPTETLADDPLVGFVARFTAELQGYAAGRGSLVVSAAGAIVGLGLAGGIWQWSRRRAPRSGRLVGK